MKKTLLALVATMFLAVLFSSTVIAADMRPADDKATLAQVEDILNRQMSTVDVRLKYLKEQMAYKANANQVPTAQEMTDVRHAIDDHAAVDRLIKGRLNKLKLAIKADRADIEALITEVKNLRGVSKDTIKALNGLVVEVAEVKAEVKAHDGRLTSIETRAAGIETRQNTTDANVARVEAKTDAVVASLWRSELQLGVETGRDIATASTNAVVGIGSKLPSGYGWWTAFSLGLGDVLAAPHPTSVAFRAGVTSTVGGSSSPLSAQFGLLAGMAAKTSLALDAGIAVGATVGLTYKPRGWPVGFTASAGQVFGRFEGFIVHAGLYFDPLALGDLGK
jgi:hypothetical protein